MKVNILRHTRNYFPECLSIALLNLNLEMTVLKCKINTPGIIRKQCKKPNITIFPLIILCCCYALSGDPPTPGLIVVDYLNLPSENGMKQGSVQFNRHVPGRG